jgi:hypothetical protein
VKTDIFRGREALRKRLQGRLDEGVGGHAQIVNTQPGG